MAIFWNNLGKAWKTLNYSCINNVAPSLQTGQYETNLNVTQLYSSVLTTTSHTMSHLYSGTSQRVTVPAGGSSWDELNYKLHRPTSLGRRERFFHIILVARTSISVARDADLLGVVRRGRKGGFLMCDITEIRI